MKQFTKKKLRKWRDNTLDLIMVAMIFYAFGWLFVQGSMFVLRGWAI